MEIFPSQMLLNPSLFTPPKFVILTNGGGKARGDNDCQVDVEIPIRQAASTTVSTLYSWLADWILPVSDSPSSVTAHYHGETSARTAVESLLLELNLAWRLRETLTLSNRVMQSPYKGEGIQMVTKVSLWISTTETCKNSRTKTITLL